MTDLSMTETEPSRAAAAPLLALDDLAVHYAVTGRMGTGRRMLKAVDGIDLDVKPGECLGLVGESGCGKSTLALAIMGLVPPTRGHIRIAGQDIGAKDRPDRKLMARTVQMVFQDPYASLNPRQTVRRTLADPLRLHGVTDRAEIEGRVADMLARVGLRPEHADRYPHEFSGGQRQRIGIARALILKPRLVICDEPVSALDVSIRAQIINLLLELKDELGLSYIMISHDLGVVEHMSDRVAVMYLGRIVERGGWREIFENPRHPYTRALIAAIPDPFRQHAATARDKAKGEIASALNPPSGCHFHPRCPMKQDRCTVDVPTLDPVTAGHGDIGHWAACHYADRVGAA
ncbi:ABC transporter ATP-binding protein [Allostella vacuolata]|nr:ABC transporter ATP-binding protein [Stella vacuolata]